VQREDERLRRLVEALDAERDSMAETWRLVAAAAAANASLQPSYALVRRLVLAERRRRKARAELRRVALEAATTVLTGGSADGDRTLPSLEAALLRVAAAEVRVSETQSLDATE
jgi:hypothetical protein